MTIALITGTSTGIGLATVLHLARNGYQVYAGVRKPDQAELLRREVEGEKLPVSLVRLDVDDEASVAAGVREVLQQAGRIDVLVNNAGIAGSVSPLELVPLEAAKATFETNYFGAIRMIQAVVPGMRTRQSGAIINVTSIAGRVSMAINGHYVASKYALEGASEALAQELSPFNIRVALIEPGVILTPIFEKNQAAADPNTPYLSALARFGRFFEAQLQNPTKPDAVAKVIQLAIETPRPKLRYLVGRDAEALAVGRQQTSDEAWIAGGAVKDDEAFYDRMRQQFGLDLWRRSANSEAATAPSAVNNQPAP